MTWGRRLVVVARAARAPRRCAASAALVAAVAAALTTVLVGLLLGACTSGVGGPVAADASTSGPAVAGSGPATPASDPRMTPVDPAPGCTLTRPLTGKGLLPLDAVFPGAESRASSDPQEVVPGADARDRTRCPGALPAEPLCDQLVPWTGLVPDAFVPASGARRLVQGYLLTMPRQAGNQAPPESSAGTKAVTFGLVDLAAGDPARLVDFLRAAFATCAKARSGAVAGVAALVGTVRSEYGAGSAQVVLLRRGSHVVWASLDGSGWQAGEELRALSVVVERLL